MKVSKHSKWLVEEGFEVERNSLSLVHPGALYFHPEGHPLHHPRAEDPVDEALVLSLMEEGNHVPLVVRVEFDEHKNRVLAVCDGARRARAAMVAQTRLREAKNQRILKELDGRWVFPLKVDFLTTDTTDADFLYKRQELDHEPTKKPHSTYVLCKSVIQLDKYGVDVNRILSVLPRGWTPGHVEMVTTMPMIAPELAARFDARDESGAATVSIGLLPAVLSVAPVDREEVLDDLVQAGCTSPSAATRRVNAYKRENITPPPVPRESDSGAATADAPDIDDDGLDSMPPSQASPGTNKPSKLPGQIPNRIPNARRVQHTIDTVRDQPKMSPDMNAFTLGAQMGIGGNADSGKLLKELLDNASGLGVMAQTLIAGFCWRFGMWDNNPQVQGMVSASVHAALDKVTNKKRVVSDTIVKRHKKSRAEKTSK